MLKKVAVWKGRIKKGVFPICYLCGKPITEVKDLSQDHVVSRSKHGKTVDSNILPAHKICNSRKSSMSVVEWFDMINKERERS